MKRFDLLAAAVLAVGGIGLAASPAFAQDQPAQQQQQPAGQSTAQPAAGQPAADQARQVLQLALGAPLGLPLGANFWLGLEH